jgi:hypothetical protein
MLLIFSGFSGFSGTGFFLVFAKRTLHQKTPMISGSYNSF